MRLSYLKYTLTALLLMLALSACGDSAQSVLSAPTDIKAVAGPDRVTVSWQDNSDAEDGFIVYRRTVTEEAEANLELRAETETDLTTFVDTEVEPGQPYVYAVSARGQDGESALSEESTPAVPETPEATLSIVWQGGGEGRLTSDPAGLNCQAGEACSANFDLGTEVSLNLNPAASSSFTGWGGACEGAGACKLVLNDSAQVTVNLQGLETLTVLRAGQGSGTVTSDPAGIECKPDGLNCSAQFIAGTAVTLTASPAEKSAFAGWSGACSGENCTLTLDDSKTVTATFEQRRYTLSVEKTGPGGGEVTSVSPAGISCGDDCSEAFIEGTVDSLRASADAGSRFTGWQGADCSGTANCRVTLNADQTVSADFTFVAPVIESFSVAQPLLARGESTTLNWTVMGQGDITLSINRGVGDVSGQQSATISPTQTTNYTLTARSQYGTTTAQVSVTVGDAPAIAAFTAEPATILSGDSTLLSWSVSGDAPVTLRLTPGNVDVSDDTSIIREPTRTTNYKLTATNRFGIAEARVKVTVQAAYELSVIVTPQRGGRVVSVPSGINCGRNSTRCSAIFIEGTEVNLGVVRGDFERWENCPEAVGLLCSLTVTQDLAVTAVFDD